MIYNIKHGISSPYLPLDGDWNKSLLPHQGRHPNAYHDFMLEGMKNIDSVAKGNVDIFLAGFEKVKRKVIDNADMLTKDFWK